MTFTKKALLCSSIALALNSHLSLADTSGISISPMLGIYSFDDETNLDNTEFGALAIGYRFNPPWQIELTYSNLSADFKDNSGKIDGDEIKIDALYHFWPEKQAHPYIAIGFGQQSIEGDVDSEDKSIINVGLGFNVAITNNWSFRTDLRNIRDTDDDYSHFAWTNGIQYQFGDSRPAKKAEPSPPVDADNDGILDSVDRCLGTAPNTPVDANGCALPMDDDNDGVVNSVDQCPDSASGSVVDENGCYVVIKETKEVALEVKFENNSFVVSPASYSEIERVSDFMTQYPLTKVTIEGHTDDRGAAAYNQQLSQKRADAVAAILVSEFGIDRSRVSAVGFGEEQPLVNNDTKENRAKNRRVTAKVSAQVEKVQTH